MIRILAALALVLGASQAMAMDEAYFKITKVTVKEVTEQYPQMDTMVGKSNLAQDCSSQRPLKALRGNEQASNVVDPLGAIEVFVDQIINIGKKVWAIIDAGRPVVNLQMDVANALPKGVTCWSDLSGWNIPRSKVYQVVYENGFGMAVVDYTYRVTFTAGGGADGVGQYITNATFMPANVEVGWGFEFAANAEIPSVFNTGTSQAPVAGMQMNMKWMAKSPMTHAVATESFYVGGNNQMKKLQ
jgi:hypothetical protein